MLHLHSLPAITHRLPQIVEVGDRDVRQPAVTQIAEDLMRSQEEAAHGGPGEITGEIFMRGIGLRQPRHIRRRVQAGKTRSAR